MVDAATEKKLTDWLGDQREAMIDLLRTLVDHRTFIHRRNLGDFRPKCAGKHKKKFSQANEALRRETEYHTCPLGADVAAAARIPFTAHRHSVVAAHWPVAAERDNKRT